MRISDWSSDVCSSDLDRDLGHKPWRAQRSPRGGARQAREMRGLSGSGHGYDTGNVILFWRMRWRRRCLSASFGGRQAESGGRQGRSEEHTSELQSLMRISYAVFCLKKTKQTQTTHRKQ